MICRRCRKARSAQSTANPGAGLHAASRYGVGRPNRGPDLDQTGMPGTRGLEPGISRPALHPTRLPALATELADSGLPIHIGAALLGHLNLETFRGYVTVFDDDVVRHYQAHLEKRRKLRPAEEYRDVTHPEWNDFVEHFDKRKVELGGCARPYGTGCQHEHTCFSELTWPCPTRCPPNARSCRIPCVALSDRRMSLSFDRLRSPSHRLVDGRSAGREKYTVQSTVSA